MDHVAKKQEQKTEKRILKKSSIIILAILMIFMVWAVTAPLAKGLVATGIVVVDSRRKTIQHLEGGVVKAIYVQEGSRVKANDILLELDDTKARAERDMLRSRYLMKAAILDRLMALQTNSTQLMFRQELMNAKNSLDVSVLITTQTRLFQVLRHEQEGKRQILQQRVGQLEQKVKGLEAYHAATEKQMTLLEKEIQRMEGLLAKHLIDSATLAERQQLFTQQQGELGKTVAGLWESKAAIGEAQLNILQLDKELQQEIAKEMSETQEAFIELKSQLDAAESVLARTVVKAPQAGVILGLKIHTLGGVIAPANPIMDIVPQNENLTIEAHIRPLDVDAILPNMLANVRFSSFKAKTTPELIAKVNDISADIITDTKGDSYYLAKLTLVEGENAKLHQLTVIPGMPVEVYVNAGTRTLMQYLFDPLAGVFRRGMRED